MTWLMLAGLIVTLTLTLLNLSLTAAVIRHLRDRPATPGPSLSLTPPGRRIGAFTARTTTGAPLTDRDLADGRSLVAFVSAGCPPCEVTIDELASGAPVPGERLVLFVAGDDRATAEVAARVPWALVSRADLGGPIGDAFGGVDGYPRVFTVADAVITRSGLALDQLAGAHA
ncbi:hypothetical protein [Catenuloplanes atrovinosus]|uniref:Thioredoxin domain-containing protein n=1 Tax=Catenuloplanes atrovinosus TaxID=137266 RepID=A0AAE4CAK1_9ACTN|nr:hypothetical protein [Catenuloplanes atrovinosus]MDR7277077.1 hypothetical protein [Catenuloplanes atrovinosus]